VIKNLLVGYLPSCLAVLNSSVLEFIQQLPGCISNLLGDTVQADKKGILALIGLLLA